MSYLKSFNKVLEDFITELSEMYPSDKEIDLAKNTIYLLKKTNPRKLIEFFYQYFLPFEEKIKNKDESFFISRNYDEDVSEYVKSLNVITNLKKYWEEMSVQTKNNIWLYMQIMIKLCKKYMNAV